MLPSAPSVGTVPAFIIALLVGLWAWYQWRHRQFLRVASNIPYMFTALPILGHAHYTIFGMEEVVRVIIIMILQSVAKGLNTICFWCGPFPIIFCHDPEDIQKILNSSNTLEKADEYKFIRYAIGNGLLTAPWDIWRVTRRHMNPLFMPGNIDQLMPTFNKNSRELVMNLSEYVGSGPVELMNHTMDIALKTVCHFIFGVDMQFDIKSENFRGLRSVVEKIPEIVSKRVIRVWLRCDALFNLLYKNELLEINHAWKRFSETPLKVAWSKNGDKDVKKRNTDDNSQEADEGPTNLIDVYSVLQKNYPQFSDEDLKSEIITLYCTGSDTVGVAVATCLLLLAQYQDIQERMYQEIIQVVSPDEDVTIEDLQRMPYLDQVYRETLRWSMIVPFIGRKTTEEIKLSTCKLPAGYTVAVGIGGLHMNPTIYPEPQTFNPDRFAADNAHTMERYSFLPFSGGSRNCIGKQYAERLVKVMVTHVLRTYKLTTKMDVHTMKRKYLVVLSSAEGYNVTLDKRS